MDIVSTTSMGLNTTTLQQTTPMWSNKSTLLPTSFNDTNYVYEYELEQLNTSEWANMSSSEEPDSTPGFSFPEHLILKVILCTTVLVITLLGNALVIWAYATTKKLRTYSNHLIIGLAVADLVSGGITPGVINLKWFLGYWPYSEYLCLVFVYINHIFFHATFLMTMIICFDRFWALNMPLHHLKGKSSRRAYSMIAVGYIVPILIWTPLVVIFPYAGLTTKVVPPLCHPSYGLHPYLLLFAALTLSWIPMIVTVILYAFVYSAVIRKGHDKKRSVGERISSDFSDKQPSKKVQSKKSVKDKHAKTYSPSDASSNNDNQAKAYSQSRKPPVNDIHAITHKASIEAPTTDIHVKTLDQSNDQPITNIQGNIQTPNNGHTETLENTCKARDAPSDDSLAKDRTESTSTHGQVFSVSKEIGFTNQAYEDTEGIHNQPDSTLPLPKVTPAVCRPSKQPVIKHLHSSKRSKLESRLASIRATRTLTYILIIMLASGLPWSVTPLMSYLVPTINVHRSTSMFFTWISHLSSLINPFCYAVCNPLFKEAFIRILCCRKSDRRSRSSVERSRQRNSQASQNRQ